MKKSLLIAIFAVAIGFAAGRLTHPGSSDRENDQNDPRLRSPMAAYLPLSEARKLQGSGSGGGSADGKTDGGLSLTKHEMSYALKKALAEPNPVTRMAAVSQLLSNLDESNLDSALEVFKDIPIRSDNKQEYEMLLYAWGRFDGAGAIEYASKNLTARGISADALRQAVLPGWASNDPAAAAAWLDEKTKTDAAGAGRELADGKPIRPNAGYAAALIKGWAEKDPYAAAAYLGERFDHGKQRETLMGHIASNIIKDGASAAVDWAESFTDDGLKEEAFEELAEDWSSIDPAATGAWLAKHINEPYSKEAVEDLARGWAVKDLDAAVDWFETLDDGLTRGTGIYELMKIWAPQSTEDSGEWLAGLPEGSISRDMGVSAYAAEISRDNPEAAAEWLSTIGDEDIMKRGAGSVLQNWMRQDSEAAVAWAQENEFFPEEQLRQLEQQQAQMRTITVNGASMQVPIGEIRKGLQNELPADAVIDSLPGGGVSIRHDGQTFELPAELINNDLPEIRESIGSR